MQCSSFAKNYSAIYESPERRKALRAIALMGGSKVLDSNELNVPLPPTAMKREVQTQVRPRNRGAIRHHLRCVSVLFAI